MIDQGLFACANLAVNLLLARWLSPEAYGAFTVAFVLFWLLGAIHGGLLVEPMLVYGPGRFRERLPAYLRVLVQHHMMFSLYAGLGLVVMAGIALSIGSGALAAALATLAVAQSAILFLWLMRRAYYIMLRPQGAALGGGVYLALVVGGAFTLQSMNALTGSSGLALMGGGALLVGAGLAAGLGIPFRRSESDLSQAVAKVHGQYGRWAAPTGVLEWAQGAIPFLVLPLVGGLALSGTLRALYNLAMPALHASSALTVLAIPILVGARRTGQELSTALRLAIVLGVAALVYGLGIGLFGDRLLDLLYSGQYQVQPVTLWMLATAPFFAVVGGVLVGLLRAREQPRALFSARATSSGVMALVGSGLVAFLGVAGAVVADLVAMLAHVGVLGRYAQRGKDDWPTRLSSADLARRTSRSASRLLSPSGSTGGGRRRVLLVAYACSPGRSSEPGHGWRLVCEAARRHDVWLVTYRGFKAAIERELAARPIPGLRVCYYRLPFESSDHWQLGLDRQGVREQVHYYAWQVGARGLVRALCRQVDFDLAHHVTLVRYWSPSAAAAADAPFLWGPVGGGESAPRAFYHAFSLRGRLFEHARDWARRLAHRDPLVLQTAAQSTLTLATTPETAAKVRMLADTPVDVVGSVALDETTIARLATVAAPTADAQRFLSIGRLVHWKGFEFGLRAFAQVCTSGDPAMENAAYWIVGEGPERKRLERLAERAGIRDQVHFLGWAPPATVHRLLSQAHVVVHPSLHDSGGYATLEAMAAGRPVVCLDRGGPGQQVTPDTGIAVRADTPSQAVDGIAAAMRRLAADPTLREEMGRAGRRRITSHYSWRLHGQAMRARYASLMGLSEGTPAVVLSGPSPIKAVFSS